MKFFSKCSGCHIRKLFIKKRVYNTLHAGSITSQDEICKKCMKKVKLMLGDEIKGQSRKGSTNLIRKVKK
jgi:hypothetical protein